MKEREEDEYEIRQQDRVLQDSLQMIPDTQLRLAKAIITLQELVTAHQINLARSDELEKATLALHTAKA